MKLIIQIPCKDEEVNLPIVISELPKSIPWISIIEIQVIDDGSTDNTYEVAKNLWVHHIVKFTRNRGLWEAFKAWISNALKNGADIVVNTDADNQYPGRYIAELVRPIVEKRADIVIWNRNPTKVSHFNRVKKRLQGLGNFVVWFLAGNMMPDSVSWFRAYSRESLYSLNVTSKFSYVIDTIIQAHKKWLEIKRIDIETNAPTRPSRLFENIWQHIKKSTANIVRVYTMYEPFKIFMLASLPFLLIGMMGILRYLYYFLVAWGAGKIQSLILSSIVIMVGINFFSLWVIGDVIAKNRMLIEENMSMVKKLKFEILWKYNK